MPNDSRALADLIAWYAAMGVDVAVAERPINHLQPAPAPSSPAPTRPRTDSETPPGSFTADRRNALSPTLPRVSVPAAVAVSTSEIERAARSVAAAATNLDELREALGAFEGCSLKLTATQLVFADGNPNARVMMVGEAPGRDEDIQGLPFVGRSGQLLDRMLAAIGLDRSGVYIANVVPWRPPGNRTPTPQETAACRPFIERQIALADPDFLICLGGPAAAELMSNREGILKFRGRWQEYDTGIRKIRAMATLHPAYLLRQPLQKRLAWRDFLALKAALDEAA